jgi:hypothetical protein
MKATKIRAYLVVPALAAVLGLTTHIASADTVSPSGNFSASLCTGTKVTIKLGTATVTCNTSSTSGTVPAPTASGTPVCGAVNAPTLTSCTVSAGFTFPATCTASGTWNLCVTPTTSTLTGGTVNCTASVLGQTCRANSAAVTLNGSWSNASSSAAFSNQPVNVTTSGGFPCPSGNSASFSASYCTSPALMVTDP